MTHRMNAAEETRGVASHGLGGASGLEVDGHLRLDLIEVEIGGKEGRKQRLVTKIDDVEKLFGNPFGGALGAKIIKEKNGRLGNGAAEPVGGDGGIVLEGSLDGAKKNRNGEEKDLVEIFNQAVGDDGEKHGLTDARRTRDEQAFISKVLGESHSAMIGQAIMTGADKIVKVKVGETARDIGMSAISLNDGLTFDIFLVKSMCFTRLKITLDVVIVIIANKRERVCIKLTVAFFASRAVTVGARQIEVEKLNNLIESVIGQVAREVVLSQNLFASGVEILFAKLPNGRLYKLPIELPIVERPSADIAMEVVAKLTERILDSGKLWRQNFGAGVVGRAGIVPLEVSLDFTEIVGDGVSNERYI